ncbi:type II and III secretion system protein [Hydrogenobaculum acidophilum]
MKSGLKNKFKMLCYGLCVSVFLTSSISNANSIIKNMKFENAKLSDVIKTIASIDNKSVMFGPKFKDEKVNIDITRPISADELFNDILREYCLSYTLTNGIFVINSGKCISTNAALPPLSSLLKNSGYPLASIPTALSNQQTFNTKTETIILRGISAKDAYDLIKPIKGIYKVYLANKINVIVVSGSSKAIKEVNTKLKPYFQQHPRFGEALISAPLYVYDISPVNFEKLISHYLSKEAVIIHEEGNKIILEDYPKNIENVLDYFPQYVSVKPKYITEVLFIKKDLDKAYNLAKACRLKNVAKSSEFKAIVLTGAPQSVVFCEKKLSSYVSKAPRKNVMKSETFYIKYITLDKFEKLIKPYLSDKAIVTPINKMDAVTIIDYIQNLEDIKKHLKQYISTKPLYIQIDVKAIEISKDYQKQLGLGVGGAYEGRGITLLNTSNFNPTNPLANAFSFIGSGGSPSVVASPVNPPNGLISGIYSEGKFHILGFEIQALESINKAKSVFKSTLLAMNDQPTLLTQGIEYPFTTISTPGQAVPTVTLQNVLNSIKVTPQVLPNGKILLNINIQNMSLGPLASNGQPTINQNSNSLSIVLSDGATLAIGGVGLKNESNSLQGIPGLDKVPIVGNIGMNKNESSNDTNLFIFITAKRVEK